MKRMVLAFCLAFALVICSCALPHWALQSALAEQVVWVRGNEAEARSGPGTEYYSYGHIDEDSQLTYLGNSRYDSRGVEWFNVRWYGYSVWVSSRQATLEGTAAQTVWVKNNEAYAHSGPGREYYSFGYIPEDSILAYLGQISYDERGVAWYKVRWYGNDAWVSSRQAVLQGTASQVLWIRGNEAQARSGPGTEYLSYGHIDEDSLLDYLGQSLNDNRGVTWYYARWNGYYVWISSRQSEIVGMPALTQTVWVKNNEAHARSGPGTDYYDYGYIPEDTVLSYQGDMRYDSRGVVWYKIRWNGYD